MTTSAEIPSVTLSADLLERALTDYCLCFTTGDARWSGHNRGCARGDVLYLIAEARGTLCPTHNRPPGYCPSWQHPKEAESV